MKLQEFEQHYQHLRTLVDNILIKKRAEYADGEDDGDRLSNFKAACSTFRTNPAMICLYYASKHWEACVKLAQDIDKGIYPSEGLLDEKCQDLSAYTALFHACVMEQIQAHNNICPVAAQEALQGASDPKDDSDTVSTKNDENFSKNEDSLNFYNTYRKQFEERQEELLKYHPELLKYCLENSPILDTSDSITKTLRPDVSNDLNLRTNL